MPSNNSINLPAGYAPAFAIGFSDQGGQLAIVDAAKPLPVAILADTPILVQEANPVVPAALEDATGVSVLAGPFVPAPGRQVMLTLSGEWEGNVQVERSADAGATRHRLTAAGIAWGNYSGNASEAVWVEEEAGAELYLDISIASGTLEYRISQ